MKSLKNILKKVDVLEIIGSENINVSSICFDSRKVKKGSLFIAISGTQVDGHNFIENAVASGAVAIISEKFPSELTTISFAFNSFMSGILSGIPGLLITSSAPKICSRL